MNRQKSATNETELAAFRVPVNLKEMARKHCQAEDVTFSQLMRRAIRRELASVGIATEEKPASQPQPEAVR